MTSKFDLSDPANHKAYLNAVKERVDKGLPVDPQDIGTSKAILFYYQGYAMGEKSGTSAQMAGSLNDGKLSSAMLGALDAFSRSSESEQQKRYDFFPKIQSNSGKDGEFGEGTRSRYVDVTRDGRTVRIEWNPTSSDYAGKVGVGADEALRKTDFGVYDKVVDAAFATSSLYRVDIEGTWRPPVADYMRITGEEKPYSVTSFHISSRAIDISSIYYVDASGQKFQDTLNNEGYSRSNSNSRYSPITTSTDIIDEFKTNLLGDRSDVKEVYDPWSMWKSGQNGDRENSPRVLKGKDDLDYLHRNHLHISFKK